MNPKEEQLAQLLRQADAESPAHIPTPLDANQLMARVAERRRKRMATRTVTVAVLLVACVASLRLWPISAPEVAKSAVEAPTLEELSATIAEIETEIQQLQEQMADSPTPTYDLISAMKHSSHNDLAYREKLRHELAELESRVAANDAALNWQRAWFRSGALRLELAKQEAQIDPQRAADAYRQIAQSYAGTPWGDQARVALTEFATP